MKQRWVVKLGTGILTCQDGNLDGAQMDQLIEQIVALRKKEVEVILVSSGAVTAGRQAMGFRSRPRQINELQACATVGQTRLMSEYQSRLTQHGLWSAQLLLTYWDLDSRSCYENARQTLDVLLHKNKFVPIINENDAISGEEIKVGDNDRLSAHVAVMAHADLLVILSNVDGLLSSTDAHGQVLRTVSSLDDRILAMAQGPANDKSVGGMVTKLDAARIAAEAGIDTIIANGRNPQILTDIARGKFIGTRFHIKRSRASQKESSLR